MLVGLIDDELLAWPRMSALIRPSAEIALLVEDRYQHLGIGSALIESLASVARANGVTRFVAYVLIENSSMIRTVRHLGLPTATRVEDERRRHDDRAQAEPLGRDGQRMTCTANVIWDEAYLAYDFGDHPLNPLRLEFTMALARALGVLDQCRPAATDYGHRRRATHHP